MGGPKVVAVPGIVMRPAPRMTRLPVFNRLDPAIEHPYERALGELLAKRSSPRFQDVEEAMIARNLCHDPRVTAEREREFEQLRARHGGADAIDGNSLLFAAWDYFEDRIRRSESPDFLERALNGPNFLDVEKARLDPEEWLVRVFNLNGIPPLYAGAVGDRRWAKVFEGYGGAKGKWDIYPWLDGKLKEADATARASFVRAVVEVLNTKAARPFHPVWVSRWEDFRKAIGWEPDAPLEPERWLEVTGISTTRPGSWHILFLYRAREVVGEDGRALPIVRPTILDSYNGRFFPSPPAAIGGHPIDLLYDKPGRVLIPEFIHPQITVKFEHWSGAGEMLPTQALAWIRKETGTNIHAERQAHRSLLGLRYQDAMGWMPDPC